MTTETEAQPPGTMIGRKNDDDDGNILITARRGAV